MSTRTAVAIVLARAGSKGLPRKNSLPVAGKPCAQWTIEAALAARTVGLVAMSTDDLELLDLAGRLGALAIPRPPELASDSATVDAAARQALGAVAQAAGARAPVSVSSPDLPVVILYANVPVRPAGLIDRAVERLIEAGCDSVQSYAPVGKHHPWWTVRVDGRSGAVGAWEGDVLYHGVYRRQDLPAAYVPDGGVVVVTRRALMAGSGEAGGANPHAFLGADRRGVLTGEGEVVDIDSKIDLLVAEAVLRERAGTS